MARLALAYAKEPRNFWGKNKRMCVLCVESLKEKKQMKDADGKKWKNPACGFSNSLFGCCVPIQTENKKDRSHQTNKYATRHTKLNCQIKLSNNENKMTI
jgi:hypothetical protein